jgi:enamine deaminase RidA (YjgF/YER057c/UK114 family)
MNGLVQSFNVEGLSVAPGFPIKHITVADMGAVHLLTLSGLLGTDSSGKLVGPDTYTQTIQALKNIKTVICYTAKHLDIPLDESEALSCILFSRADLADQTQAPELNRAYIDAGMPHTGRAAMQVAKLPLGAAVEITVQAILPKN